MSAVLNYHTLLLSAQTQHKDITQQQKNSTLLHTTKSSMPTSTEDQLSTMRKEMSSCSLPTSCQQTSSSCPSCHHHGQVPSKYWSITLRIRMSLLTCETFRNSATFVISSTSVSSNSSHQILIFIFHKENWAALVQLQNTDGKLKKYFNSEANQGLVRHNTKSHEKDSVLSTINCSSQHTLIRTLSSNSGYMVAWQLPITEERPTNPHTMERADKKLWTWSTRKEPELLEELLKRRNLKHHSL